MDNIVVLTPNKKLIKLKTSTYELTNLFFDTFGFLQGFNVGSVRYIFIDKNGYLEGDKEKNNIVVGFVNYESYGLYSGSEQNYYNYTFIIDSVEWFDSTLVEAKIGDIFRIEKLETSPDANKTNNYTKYFVRFKCEFKINNLQIDFTDETQYPIEDSNTSSANYCIKTYLDKSLGLNNINESNFFKKNLGSKITSLTIEDASKKILYVGMIKICWRIRLMYSDVLEKFAIKNLSEIYNIVTQNIPVGANARVYIDNLPNLSSIDKVIAKLLLDWGYRDYDNTLELFPNVEGDQFYAGYYKPFENYLNTLVNIYVNIAYNKKEQDLFGINSDPSTWTPQQIIDQSNLRLQYLVSIIPIDSINFLDLDTKIKILKDFAVNSIYESREDAVVKIT